MVWPSLLLPSNFPVFLPKILTLLRDNVNCVDLTLLSLFWQSRGFEEIGAGEHPAFGQFVSDLEERYGY
jgi:hypothetical protein